MDATGSSGDDGGGGASAVFTEASSMISDFTLPRRVSASPSSSPLSLMSKIFGGGGALPLSVPVPPLRIPRSPRCAAPSLISSNVCTCLTADANPAASIRLRTISRSPEFHSRSVPICPIAASMSRNAQLTSAVFRVAVPESHPELSLPCRDEESRLPREGRSPPGASPNSGARIFLTRRRIPSMPEAR